MEYSVKKAYEVDFQSRLSLAALAGSFQQAMQNPPFMVKQRYQVEIGQDESMGGRELDSSDIALEMHADFIAKALKVMPGFASSLPGASEGGLILQVGDPDDDVLVGTAIAYGSNRTIIKDARRALHHFLAALGSHDSALKVSDEMVRRI